MKVSYNWLQDYFKNPLPKPEELGNLLTFHSFELEGIEKIEDDYVIDVDILPNRSSDCLSHRGIAREIATLLAKELMHDPLYVDIPNVEQSKLCTVEVEDAKLCDQYVAHVIKGVKVKSSPEWLKKKLETLGQRSINNIVDATNFIMLNTGQPLHAFDYNKLSGDIKNIQVRNAEDGEEITTLTDDTYTLSSNNLLITDGNSKTPIGIAGVKGGKAAEVDENTTDVIIESAHFDFTSVRKTSQQLKLWTDASTRFQNNPSPKLVAHALRDVSKLIIDIAGGELEGEASAVTKIKETTPVEVSVSDINGLLGVSIDVKEVGAILDRFEWQYTENNGIFSVTPSFERTDVNIAEDIIEEVGRVYGYEHLEAKQLPPLSKKVDIHKQFYFADIIRNILTQAGFNEIYGYTFRDNGAYEVVTPLASDKAFLRTNLSDGMREYLALNIPNAPLFGIDRIKLFEIGSIFPKERETISLAIGISGKKAGKLFDEVKTVLQEKLGVSVHAEVQENVLEVDFNTLIEPLSPSTSYEPYKKNNTTYTPFSPYPFMLRDIAVWVLQETSEKDLVKLITEEAGDLLLRIDCFDRFEKEGKVSYAFHMVFQSQERTLSDEEINTVMDHITETLNTKEGFDVR